MQRTLPGVLRKYFTRQETLQLMLNCGENAMESEKIIEPKLDYLIQRACHKAEAIAKSKALTHTYKHIVMRHEFLIRAGLFKTVPYNKLHKQIFTTQPRYAREKYFTPAQVVCSNDRTFLAKCTNNCLSLNELAAFEDVFKANYEKWGLGEEDLMQDAGANDVEIDDDEDILVGSEFEGPPVKTAAASFFKEKDISEFYY